MTDICDQRSAHSILAIMREFPRDTDTIARWADVTPALTARTLRAFAVRGWVECLELGGYDWWRLTAAGVAQQEAEAAVWGG